jgi:3-oxoacyl-(acyl-carrier-protein) synthase
VPGDIDYINAHGTSTYMNDKSESAAIHAVFGEQTSAVSVSSTKSSMGHLIAAAGAVEVVVCALAIQHGELPVNANLRERDPDCDLNLVVAPAKRRVRMTLSNSFGFGGSNSCVALRHPDEVAGAG